MGQAVGNDQLTGGMLSVRKAKPEDKWVVIRLLRDAHAAAGFGGGKNPFQYEFQAAYAERAFVRHLSSPDAVALVLVASGPPVGVLMARVFDYELGPTRVAKETVWWIDPDHRGRAAMKMLAAYEEWASDRGAQFAGMAALQIAPRAEEIYRRRDYQAVETHFLKSL